LVRKGDSNPYTLASASPSSWHKNTASGEERFRASTDSGMLLSPHRKVNSMVTGKGAGLPRMMPGMNLHLRTASSAAWSTP